MPTSEKKAVVVPFPSSRNHFVTAMDLNFNVDQIAAMTTQRNTARTARKGELKRKRKKKDKLPIDDLAMQLTLEQAAVGTADAGVPKPKPKRLKRTVKKNRGLSPETEAARKADEEDLATEKGK